ncbi:MAG: hypothetical protein U0M42_02045 [Acutalibacteraceae bacterium]|nr:hypothetical protein [Acutalibacteraceae bacterium]
MNKKTITISGIIISLICVALRTVTLVYATEEKTGFFVSRLIPVGIALSAATFILTLIITAFSFTVKENAQNEFALSKKSGVFAVVLGVAILAYSLGFGTHQFAMEWQHTLEIVSGIACAVWFIFYGMTAIVKMKLPLITMAIPAIHWVIKIMVIFSTFSTAALVAEHIYTLSAVCITALFMLTFGKTVAGVSGKKALSTFYPTAICAAILNFTVSLSRIIVAILGQTDKIHGEAAVDIVGLAVGLLMLFITADIGTIKNEENENEIQC